MKRRTFLGAAAASALPLPALAQSAAATTLKFVPQASLTILDPIWTTAAVTTNHGFYVFDTLFGVDSTLTPHPQMAAGYTESDDKRSYTITLRDGLKFHDGTPVLGRDCAASLKRWAARDTFGQTLGAAVDAWEAPDDKTVRIRLKRPFPQTIAAIAKPAANLAFIMPQRLAETDPNKQVTEMIGSGPYKFIPGEFVTGSRVVYEKFDGYVPREEKPDWTSGGKVAHFPRVEWHVIPDPATAAAAMQSGEVDWWEQVQADLVPLMRRNPDIALRAADPSGFLAIMRFECINAPSDNAKLRQAIMAAVDQREYMEAVTGNDATAYKLNHALFPVGTPYGIPPSPDPMAHPDLARAKEMVKASGYNGEKIVVLNPSDFPSIEPLGQVTTDLLKRLGLNVDLVETDWGTVVQRRTSKKPVAEGGWSIFHTWWTGVSILNPAMNATLRGQGEKGWFGWYGNPTIEQLNQQWLQAEDPAQQASLAAQIQKLAMDDAPTIPLGLFSIRGAYRKSLTGMLEAPGPFPWNLRRS